MNRAMRETPIGNVGYSWSNYLIDPAWGQGTVGDLLQGLTNFIRSPAGQYLMDVLVASLMEENAAMRSAIQRGDSVAAAVASGRVDVLDILLQDAFGLGSALRARMEDIRETEN